MKSRTLGISTVLVNPPPTLSNTGNASFWRCCRRRYTIPGGGQLASCNAFRQIGINLRICCGVALGLFIYRSLESGTLAILTVANQCVLAPDSNEAAETAGRREAYRTLACSKQSPSFNVRRRSGMERSRAGTATSGTSRHAASESWIDR